MRESLSGLSGDRSSHLVDGVEVVWVGRIRVAVVSSRYRPFKGIFGAFGSAERIRRTAVRLSNLIS
jgi:hypothetical protein